MNSPEELASSLKDKWEGALLALPPEKYAAEYLSNAALVKNSALSRFSFDPLPELFAMAEVVRGNSSLLSLAAFVHWTYFSSPVHSPALDLPGLARIVDNPALFYLLVAIGFCPEYIRRQSELGIGIEILEDTCQQVGRYADNYFAGEKKTGIYTGQLSWLRNYMPPSRYYRIGRLEFCQSTFGNTYSVFRKRTTGEVAAFYGDGFWFDGAGNPCFADGERPADAWQTTTSSDGRTFTGFRITGDARVELQATLIDLSEWERVLSEGDPVLDLHIPGGGGMTRQLVRQSVSDAIKVFDRYFPDNGIKAIVSSSWIFSSQLSEFLPADSNILAFQKMLHLIPVNASRNGGLWFIFRTYGPYIPENLPRETSVQRAAADWLAAGNTFRPGAMFLLREEAESLTRGE